MATAAPTLPGNALIPTTDPNHAMQPLGQSAATRVALREEKLTELEIRGEIKPATILNRSPFVLRVETGLWGYTIPARPFDKPFGSYTVTVPLFVSMYRGNQEMSDKSLQQKFDGKILLPCHQAMEFKHWYGGETSEDRMLKQGGIIVFEGGLEEITANSKVRVPEFIYRKGKRYLRFVDAVLKELIAQADEQMYHHFDVVLENAGHDWDDPQKRKNITRYHHVVADFMLAMKRISEPPPWRNSRVDPKSTCPRCSQQYVSRTGVCKCSYVHDPLLAFMSAEIGIDHVRMNSLTAEDWVKVRAEEQRRQNSRGSAQAADANA